MDVAKEDKVAVPAENKPAAHVNEVCKLDAMQRLRELVEQLLLGAHKDKAPGLLTEPRTQRHGELSAVSPC